MKETFASFFATALVLFVIMLVLMLSGAVGCAGPSRELVTQSAPMTTPRCLLVLGPPPKPTVALYNLSHRCRDEDGQKLRPDDPCLTTTETEELTRSLAQSMAYATAAFYACQVAEPGHDGAGFIP